MNSRLIFYLPRAKSVSTKFDDLLARWQIYAENISQLSQRRIQLEFCTNRSFDESYYPNLRSINCGNSRIAQFFFLYREMRRDNVSKMLITANNYDALLICIIVRKLSKQVKVQTALHMEISSINKLMGWKGIVKKVFLNSLIPYVDNLRLVRASEVPRAMGQFYLRFDQVVVCPLPISPNHLLSLEQLTTSLPRHETIGYVGRIHEERDPFLWVDLASKILASKPHVRLLVAGDGPLRQAMQSRLSSFQNRVDFKGSLNSSEIATIWAQVKTLLITAPSESYGMAAREALLNGCFVVAPDVEAYRELKEMVPSGLFLYRNQSEALSVIDIALNENFSLTDIQSFREAFFIEQKKHLRNLALSWAEGLQ